MGSTSSPSRALKSPRRSVQSSLSAAWRCSPPQILQGHALLIVFTGLVVHGDSMTLKSRLERRDAPPLGWERVMFWLCWACLAGLARWLLLRR